MNKTGRDGAPLPSSRMTLGTHHRLRKWRDCWSSVGRVPSSWSSQAPRGAHCGFPPAGPDVLLQE